MSMLRKELVARSRSEWHEDMGDVLWWTFPISEPPYVGSPLNSNWPKGLVKLGYYTHWTPIIVPLTRSDIREAARAQSQG